jgi:hypothetical protein
MEVGTMDPTMIRCWDIMMQAHIYADSPGALYGQALALRLSEEQKKRLAAIQSEARRKAIEVLTDDQAKKLRELPDKPMSMTHLHRHDADKDAPPSLTWPMCPMMRMMSGADAPHSHPAKESVE